MIASWARRMNAALSIVASVASSTSIPMRRSAASSRPHMMSLRRQSGRKNPPKWWIAAPASFTCPWRSSHTDVASAG